MVANWESTPVIFSERVSMACAFWATVGFLGLETGGCNGIPSSVLAAGSLVARRRLMVTGPEFAEVQWLFPVVIL